MQNLPGSSIILICNSYTNIEFVMCDQVLCLYQYQVNSMNPSLMTNYNYILKNGE